MSKLFKNYIFFILCLFLFFYPHFGFSDGKKKNNNKVSSVLNTIQASYIGTTSKGFEYKLYAIKDRKEWFFLLQNKDTYSLLRATKNNPNFIKTTPLFSELIFKIIEREEVKVKNRKKDYHGMNLFCFYKFRRRGREIREMADYLETGEKKPTLAGKILRLAISPVTMWLEEKAGPYQGVADEAKDAFDQAAEKSKEIKEEIKE